MKKAILLFTFSFIISYIFAQTSAEVVKNENQYLKSGLTLNKPLTEVRNGDLTFSVIKVEGNNKSQLVTIEVLIKNKGRRLEAFTSYVKSIIDNNGVEYSMHKSFIGNKDATVFAFTDLNSYTLLTCKYVFKGIKSDVRFLRLFNYPVEYHIPGSNPSDFQMRNTEFRDLTIEWK